MTLYVGIDPSRKGYQALCCLDKGKMILMEKKVSKNEELIDCLSWIQKRMDSNLVIGVEAGHPQLMFLLTIKGFTDLYELSASKTAAYRRIVDGSGCKSDALDAYVCARYLMEMESQLTRYQPPPERVQKARKIAQALNQIREIKTGNWQRFWQEVDVLDPGIKQMGLANETLWFLEVFSNLKIWKNTGIKAFEAYLTKRKISTKGKDLEALLKGLKRLAKSESAEIIQLIVKSLRFCLQEEQLWVKRAGQLVAKWDVGVCFKSIKGMGPKTLVRLLAYVGEDWSQITDSQLSAYSGMAPVERSSGTPNAKKAKALRESGQFVPRPRKAYRQACNRHLQTAMSLFVFYSLSKHQWANDAYRTYRNRGQSHWEAIRNVGIRWNRILVAIAHKKTVYDEQIHLENQRNKKPQQVA